MWRRTASFILDNNKPPPSPPLSDSMAEVNPNPNPNPISAYYETRAKHHHGIVTSDWLEQAQAAALLRSPVVAGRRPFSVIEEFNDWRQQPDLAEAVAAIRALAAVIRASDATTMMELEIELKKASDTLKVSNLRVLALSVLLQCPLMITT